MDQGEQHGKSKPAVGSNTLDATNTKQRQGDNRQRQMARRRAKRSNLGKIDSITMKHVTYHNTDCNMVHIRFASWYNKMWLDHLKQGKTFKILYDNPRYWICSLSSY